MASSLHAPSARKAATAAQALVQEFSRGDVHRPAFPVRAEDVRLLATPRDFYNALVDGVQNARERVVLASLYLGATEMEARLVDALRAQCAREAGLRVHVHLDYLRATRKEKRADGSETSSVHMLRGLKAEHTGSVDVTLFHTPELNGLLKWVLPQRINEVVGLSHMKVYVWDDVTLLSGANLNASYFTNRQDRYVLVRDAALATYMAELVQLVGSWSFELDAAAAEPVLPAGRADPIRESARFCEHARAAFAAWSDEWAARHAPGTAADTAADTVVVPSAQMGVFGITEHEQAVRTLLGGTGGRRGGCFSLSSPYLGMTPEYAQLLTSLAGDLRVLTCAPEANGFYGGNSIVPAAYQVIEESFVDEVEAAGRTEAVHVLEYARRGWTFHAKGLWWAPAAAQPPLCTFVGSFNFFGSRSLYRDLEAQWMLVSADAGLRARMEEEHAALFAHGTRMHKQDFAKPERAVGWPVRVITRLIQTFL